jgi:hypothetical protein
MARKLAAPFFFGGLFGGPWCFSQPGVGEDEGLPRASDKGKFGGLPAIFRRAYQPCDRVGSVYLNGFSGLIKGNPRHDDEKDRAAKQGRPYRRLKFIFARRGKAQLAEDGTLAAASLRRLR